MENSSSPRNERTFPARNASRTEASRSVPGRLIGRSSQRTCAGPTPMRRFVPRPSQDANLWSDLDALPERHPAADVLGLRLGLGVVPGGVGVLGPVHHEGVV